MQYDGAMKKSTNYENLVKPRIEEIKQWIQNGYTQKQISKSLGIAYQTFSEYLSKYPEFKEAVMGARAGSICEVRSTLLKRALGYDYEEKKTYIKHEDGKEVTYTEITTKHALPDVTAIGMWLRNYDTDWRDVDSATAELRQAQFELQKRLAEKDLW